MNLDSIELHDALIKKLEVDFVGQKVNIECDYYESQNDSKRKTILITFNQVENIANVLNIKEIFNSTWAGNISYWSPAKSHATTYINFVSGCISILEKSIDIHHPSQ